MLQIQNLVNLVQNVFYGLYKPGIYERIPVYIYTAGKYLEGVIK